MRVPWEAFVLIAIEGAGSAGFWPSQSTLISRLTPAARRHAAFAQQRVTMNLGIGLGGLAAGLIAVVGNPTTFTVLFVLDALTFLAYVGVLAFVPDPGVPEDEVGDTPATYAAVLRHKTFLGLWTLNFMFVAAGYSLFTLLPAFARDQAGLSERQIGAIFFVNTLAIVLAQLPISRWIEGRRRMRALALMPALWAVAWLLVDAGGYWFTAGTAFVVIAFAAIMLGVGECFHGPAHQALVSDIGSPHLRGPLLRGAQPLVGARRVRRAGARRLHPRRRAVRALAARLAGVRDRRRRRAPHRALHPGPPATRPARGRVDADPGRGARLAP